MKTHHTLVLLLVLFLSFPTAAQTNESRGSFRVNYVAAGAVYLDAGYDAGLKEGMQLTVKRLLPGEAEMAAKVVGEIVVTSLASNSAVCEIQSSSMAFQVGDTAYLSPQDVEALQASKPKSGSQKYAQVITFSEGDPLDEEMREHVPRPPLPEVNRIRGRIGFEHSAIQEKGASRYRSSQEGLVLRADMTRIGGSYWNFTGYWRGRINSRSKPQQETLTDLINRTYQIGLQYYSPQSRYVAGVGRLYLPWASSLNTLDGGYFGRKLGRITTVGLFAGSTPDPSAWNYNPDRQIAGAFSNFEGGSFDNVRYTSTAGVALSRLRLRPEREFVFLENGIFFKRYFSIYHNLEADQLTRGRFGSLESGPVVSRSFLTLRLQPHRVVSFDVNHNYFRGIPTFDTRLLGTGLLDKFLFQGLSGGVRLDLPYRVSLYSSVGSSKRDSDARTSLNQMYGITLNRVWRTRVRADFRHSQFDSSFGKGSYKALSFSREVGDKFRLEVQGGQQDLHSSFTQQNSSRWVNSSLDWFISTHYFLGGGYMIYRGEVQSYDQMFFNLGYRF